MSRKDRLSAVKPWLEHQANGAKCLIRAYSRWFGVSRLCAAVELEMAGCPLPPNAIQKERDTELQKAQARAKTKQVRAEKKALEGYGTEWDENFSFIAGFTSGGMPYGLTWEESDPENEDPVVCE